MLRVALSGLLAAAAPASPPAIAWDVPQGCPDAAWLTAAIARRLGRELAADVALDARITRHADAPRFRLALHLRVAGREQQRSLTAERCSSLVDATAVVVAFAVTEAEPGPPPALPPADDPGQPPPEPAPPPAPEPPPPDPPEPPPVEPPPAPSPPALAPATAPPHPRPGALLRLSGGPEYGAVPGLSGAVDLTAGVLWRRVRLEFAGQYIAPRTATRLDTTARLSLFSGSVLGCARLGRGALEVPLCGGLAAGAWRTAVTGPAARSPLAPWLALTASAGVHWRVHPRVRLTLALQALAHLLRPTFARVVATAVDPVYTAEVASARLLAGVELRFRDPR